MGTAHNPAAVAAALCGRLDWTANDLYQWSLRMAERCIEAQAVVLDDVFNNIRPSGKTHEAALARAYDPSFWRRKGGLELKRAKSLFAQHAKTVGGDSGRKYVSQANADWYANSLQRQAEWAKSSFILDKTVGDHLKLTQRDH